MSEVTLYIYQVMEQASCRSVWPISPGSLSKRKAADLPAVHAAAVVQAWRWPVGDHVSRALSGGGEEGHLPVSDNCS